MRPLLKWSIVAIAVVALLYGALRLYSTFVMNPNVVEELQSNPQGERAGIVMLLTLPDGRRLPVNYIREGNTVFVGADGSWWRLFGDAGAPVTVLIRGETLTGLAQVVLDEPDYTHEVFGRLRPTVPGWLPVQPAQQGPAYLGTPARARVRPRQRAVRRAGQATRGPGRCRG